MTNAVYRLLAPLRHLSPVVFAAPHSGRRYDAALMAQTTLDALAIRSSEDAFVDWLFDCAPAHGMPLLAAEVPRAFVDLNRAPDELDAAVIEGVGRSPHNPRISSGLGVIPRVVAGGRAIYRGKLPLAEAESRIRQYWNPYHRTLRDLIEATHSRFGQAILVDCHSMPHEAIEGHGRPGTPLPDIVLGDRFGAAAGREVVDHIEAAFHRAGFRVTRNAPFAGAFIAQSYGRPSTGRHVVQVEINRALYMDESRVAPLPEFDSFRLRLSSVVAEIARFGAQPLPLAAE